MTVIADPAARDAIVSMRVAADLPADDRSAYEIMRTEGPAFHEAKAARRRRGAAAGGDDASSIASAATSAG